MNSKNYLVIGGVVAVVLLFGFILMQGQPSKTDVSTSVVPTIEVEPTVSDLEQAEESIDQEVTIEAEVERNDSGFVPASLTVKVGTTVTWTNNASTPMWVASAVHPTHQELPGFDQLTSVGNGGTYSYTFTQVGTWKYHNHVAPSERGEVVVEE